MNYFNHIASKYDQVRGKEILNSLLKTIKLFHNGDNDWILDVGTGTGLFSTALTRLGYNIIGIDINAQMLSFAASKVKKNGCHFEGVLSSAEHLPFPDNSFNIVISTNAIHHFKLQQHFQEISQILKPGGYYIIFSRFQEQNIRSIWGKYFPQFAEKEIRLYNPEDFEQLEKYFPEFKLESIEELTFEIPFSPARLINKARQKKYSTFAFYTEQEFQQALKKFETNIAKHKRKVQKIEIGRIVYKKKL